MKRIACFLLLGGILFSSCSSNQKRITVLGKGKIDIDTDTKTITIKDGAGSVEKTADFGGGNPLNIKLIVDGKESTVAITEGGLYILNAKNDTVIGSYQKYSEPKTKFDTVRQSFIKHSIDSLLQLTDGKNISAANRNYFILPFTAAKISGNVDATIVSPYHRMTSIEQVSDKEPEVYRFWSIKEIRDEMIPKLVKDTVGLKK